MNVKNHRDQQRAARKLARELANKARRPRFLVRLCHWEELCSRQGFLTLRYRRD